MFLENIILVRILNKSFSNGKMFAVVTLQITNKNQRIASITNELKIKIIVLSYLSRSVISRIMNVYLKNYMYLNKNIFIFGFFK